MQTHRKISLSQTVHIARAPVGQAKPYLASLSGLQLSKEGLMALSAHLAELSEKHRLLKRKIEEEMTRLGSDDIEIRRLKQEKLKLKDEMTRLKEETRH
jgi:hypothetical protein